jgi:putative membrane protein
MKILKYILFAIVAIVIVVGGFLFATNNSEVVTVNYLFGTLTADLFLVIIASFAMGGLLGLLASIGLKISLRLHKSKAKRQLKSMEKEVNHLKASSKAA